MSCKDAALKAAVLKDGPPPDMTVEQRVIYSHGLSLISDMPASSWREYLEYASRNTRHNTYLRESLAIAVSTLKQMAAGHVFETTEDAERWFRELANNALEEMRPDSFVGQRSGAK